MGMACGKLLVALEQVLVEASCSQEPHSVELEGRQGRRAYRGEGKGKLGRQVKLVLEGIPRDEGDSSPPAG